jgi:hypothetical protein
LNEILTYWSFNNQSSRKNLILSFIYHEIKTRG